MRKTLALVFTLSAVLGPGTARAGVQNGPATHAAPAPSAAGAKPDGGHAEPAKQAGTPAKQDSGHGEPASRSAAPAANGAATPGAHANAATTATAPAPKPAVSGKAKDQAGQALGTAITRIQERILTETGPTARRTSAVSTRPSPARPAVTLQWKTSLKWPAELQAETTLIPLPPIALEWK